MLRPMFGMGGTEILVILIVALLFLGPDKLPEAAKQISKGIRDIKKQSRVLQRTIEDDEHIGGAIRDLRSALRGDEEPVRPKPIKPPKQIEAAPTPDPLDQDVAAALTATAGVTSVGETLEAPAAGAPLEAPDTAVAAAVAAVAPEPTAADTSFEGGHIPSAPVARSAITLPPTAGEADDPGATRSAASDAAELAGLVKPAPNTIARGAAPATPAASTGAGSTGAGAGPGEATEPSERKHG